MALTFRNLAVNPDDPVAEWGVEGIVTAIDRGSLQNWRRIVAEIVDSPYGVAAENLEVALDLAEDRGVVAALRRSLADARTAAARREVSERFAAAVSRYGSITGLADALGTSRSRLSTYVSGSVVPSAVLLVKVERLVSGGGGTR